MHCPSPTRVHHRHSERAAAGQRHTLLVKLPQSASAAPARPNSLPPAQFCLTPAGYVTRRDSRAAWESSCTRVAVSEGMQMASVLAWQTTLPLPPAATGTTPSPSSSLDSHWGRDTPRFACRMGVKRRSGEGCCRERLKLGRLRWPSLCPVCARLALGGPPRPAGLHVRLRHDVWPENPPLHGTPLWLSVSSPVWVASLPTQVGAEACERGAGSNRRPSAGSAEAHQVRWSPR